MRWSLWIVGALAALGALSVCVCAQEGGSHGEPEVEATGGGTTQFCNSSTEVLIEELLTLFSEYNTTINCLAFGRERKFSGVMSVFQTNGTPVGRYNLSCESNALKARELIGLNVSRMDIRNEEYHACVECRPAAEVPEDICDRPCPIQCDKCALIDGDTLCTECYRYRLLNSYPPHSTPTAEQIENDRRRNEEAGREERCMDNPTPDPEDPVNFHCVEECPDRGNHSAVPKGKNTCFACGLEYCVECEPNETPGGHDECIECMTDTILFDGECYACPLATIARIAILQEEEEEEEARANRLRQIELAVSLPVVCFLVIIFFLAMSAYAHHRYPHISHKGHKRHRTKKPDLFSREASSPAPSAEEEPPLSESEVWRSRPTIRIR